MPKIKADPKDPWLRRLKVPEHHDIRLRTVRDGDTSVETLFQAEDRRDDWVRILLAGDAEHRALAKILKECWADTPCERSFCPLCLRRWRINLCWRAKEAIETYHPDKPLFTATLIPKAGMLSPGELATKSFRQHTDLMRNKQVLAELGDTPVIGGCDLSFNVSTVPGWENHWQVHYQQIFVGGEKKEIEEALKGQFPKAEYIPNPVRVKPVYDLLGALSYAFKAVFFRRTSYLDAEDTWNVRRPQSLRDGELRELALFFASQSFSDRLYLRKFRRAGSRLKPIGEIS